jgi:DNA repair protein RadA/Sms
MKHGFKHAIIPKANAPAKDAPQFKGINVIAVERLDDAIESAFEL